MSLICSRCRCSASLLGGGGVWDICRRNVYGPLPAAREQWTVAGPTPFGSDPLRARSLRDDRADVWAVADMALLPTEACAESGSLVRLVVVRSLEVPLMAARLSYQRAGAPPPWSSSQPATPIGAPHLVAYPLLEGEPRRSATSTSTSYSSTTSTTTRTYGSRPPVRLHRLCRPWSLHIPS